MQAARGKKEAAEIALVAEEFAGEVWVREGRFGIGQIARSDFERDDLVALIEHQVQKANPQ
jgi:hypothetical protein